MARNGCLVAMTVSIMIGADELEDEMERVAVLMEKCRRMGAAIAESFTQDAVRRINEAGCSDKTDKDVK